MATSYDLTTLDDVKDFMQKSGSIVSDDEVIEDLITRVTDMFHSYCGVDQFKQKNYVELYDGDGGRFIFPYNTPIISIATIHDDTDWEFGTDTLIDSNYYKIVDSRYIVIKNDIFTKGDQNIRVSYSAGYASIPGDLTQTCINEVSRLWNHKRNIDELDITYPEGAARYAPKDFLAQTITILKKYRKIGIY